MLSAARPEDPLPHVMRGAAFANDGRFDEAAASFSDAIKRSPRNPVLYLCRGEALQALGRDAEARSDFQRAWVLVAAAARLHSGSNASKSPWPTG